MNTRLLFVALIGLLSLVVVSTSSSFIQPASAAPQVGPLRFSEGINERLEPQGESIYFSSSNNGVYVTFDFRDLPRGTQLHRIVRWENSDYNYDNPVFGNLTCCPNGGSGRYSFLIVRRSGERNELPGGAYEVVIYNGGQEIARGGFGIRGEGGGDYDLETSSGDEPEDFGSSGGVLNPGLEDLGADDDDGDEDNDNNGNDDDDNDNDDD